MLIQRSGCPGVLHLHSHDDHEPGQHHFLGIGTRVERSSVHVTPWNLQGASMFFIVAHAITHKTDMHEVSCFPRWILVEA